MPRSPPAHRLRKPAGSPRAHRAASSGVTALMTEMATTPYGSWKNVYEYV